MSTINVLFKTKLVAIIAENTLKPINFKIYSI
ncbi:Uncharacterised protein [Legionella beliardensis]|uniref:Uncharacterized protein n=1 Tax=Legionella beliardensis TaxID=91822 RepID=A0A378I0E1_9GAMM|nr:Uncharacterised protein [Legionella beliardensis]